MTPIGPKRGGYQDPRTISRPPDHRDWVDTPWTPWIGTLNGHLLGPSIPLLDHSVTPLDMPGGNHCVYGGYTLYELPRVPK